MGEQNGYDRGWEVPPSQAELRKKKLLKTAAIVGGLLTLIGVGIVAGFFIGKAASHEDNVQQKTGLDASTLNSADDRELPAPGSPEAQAILDDSETPDYIRQIYQQVNDTSTVTPELTAKFLQRLEDRVKALGQDVDLDPFVSVANTVIDLLRVTEATALLSLLRQYSLEDRIVLEEVDMDQLQQEVNRTLQPETLDLFYKLSSVRDVYDMGKLSREWPTSAGQTTRSAEDSSASVPGTTGHRRKLQLLAPSTPSAANLAWRAQQQQLHRRLQGVAPHGHSHHGHASPRALLHDPSHHHPHPGRGLQSPSHPSRHHSPHGRWLQAADAIPAITKGDLPTVREPQTLSDMMCQTSWKTPSVNASCGKPQYGMFNGQGIIFKPVRIPVIFHCMRFKDEKGILQPTYFNPTADAQALIEATNQLYTGTHISFVLQDVRTDPKKHPYLLIKGTLDDWQQCGAGPSSAVDGFSCIGDIATKNGAKGYEINVVVVGAAFSPTYCDFKDPYAACNQVYLGYSNTNGPWMTTPSSTWSEENLEENWVFITWDYISPDFKNSAAKWNGGAATLGHEFGHYLGLRHTHEGGCAGDGLVAADAVPDTPQNMDVQSFASQKRLSGRLGGWCANYRNGKKPSTNDLLVFNSCPQKVEKTVDNVFNIMSYVPDECYLMFTENQVARMQWSIAKHRKKMFAKFS